METKKIYQEVRCEYFDEQNGCYTIDAWTNPDEDDNGRVIGWVDGKSGNIYLKNPDDANDPLVSKWSKAKQEEVRAEQKQKRGEEGETIVMLTSQVWDKIYPNMIEPDCTMLASVIRDAAYKFEQEWYAKPFEERDGYYLDMIDAFAEKMVKQLTEDYCKE